MRTDLFTPCLALGIKKGKAFALPYCIKKARGHRALSILVIYFIKYFLQHDTRISIVVISPEFTNNCIVQLA